MFKVTTDATHRKIITTNEIPVGQVFKGNLVGINGQRFPGVYYKAQGNHTVYNKDRTVWVECETVVVRIDSPIIGEPYVGYSNCFNHCRTVENYQPVTAELTIRE